MRQYPHGEVILIIIAKQQTRQKEISFKSVLGIFFKEAQRRQMIIIIMEFRRKKKSKTWITKSQ